MLTFDNGFEEVSSFDMFSIPPVRESLNIYIDDFFTFKDLFTCWKYPGGEIGINVNKDILKHSKVNISCRLKSSDSILALYQLCQAFTSDNVTVFIPYLPYSRQDRCQESDNIVKPAMTGLLYSLLDKRVRRIITFDIHSTIHCGLYDNISSNLITKKLVTDKTAVILPDKGAYTRYGKDYKNAFCGVKQRDPVTGNITSYTLKNSQGLHSYDKILVVDDICDGGATFLLLADAISKITPVPIDLYVSHGIFSKGISTLKSKYSNIYSTNSFTMDMPAGVQVLDFS